MFTFRYVILVALVACIGHAMPVGAEPNRVPDTAKSQVKEDQAIRRGLEYLAASQGEDGAWQAFGKSHPAITALALKCFLQDSSYGPSHPVSQRGLKYLLRFAQPDGGIYVPGEGMRNYHTSVAILALSASKDHSLQKTIKRAQKFLIGIQWDEKEGHDQGSAWYGGQGYGKHKRPDLSNTQLMLEAMKQSELPADDPAFKKALAFVTRCQMLSETNDQPFSRGSTDGGFIYTPANNGESKAGTVIEEGRPSLRSYGSMTYAGFKSMLYANVDRDDVRVKRAFDWIRRHYTLEHNANMPLGQSKEGLYYYYFVFAKALDTWGQDVIVDGRGKTHHWREELRGKLALLQRQDGSWVNEADRWYEGSPHLVTAYAVLSLQTAADESN